MDSLALDIKTLPAKPGLIVGNLPYGKRLSEDREVRALCRALGEKLRAEAKGWRFCFVFGDDEHAALTKLKPDFVLRFRNGGLPVVVLFGKI